MKLDLILENTRNKYALGLLEESASLTELDLLKGRMMINESTMSIRKMLVEEGTMESIKSFLEESWTMALLEEFSAEEFVPEEETGIPASALVGGVGALGAAGAMRYGGNAMPAMRAAGSMSQYGVVPAMRTAGKVFMNDANIQGDAAAVRAVPGQVAQAARTVQGDARKGYSAGMNPTRFARSNPGFAYRAGQAAGGIVRPFRG